MRPGQLFSLAAEVSRCSPGALPKGRSEGADAWAAAGDGDTCHQRLAVQEEGGTG